MKLHKLGWATAALLAGGIVGAGFQDGANKFGIVDVERVFNDSTFAQAQTQNLQTMGSTRQDILEFINTYRTIKVEDATKYRDLSLKASTSPAEKAEIERIKRDASASEAKFRELTTKTGMTPEEAKQVEELNRRKDASGELLNEWQQVFMGEVQEKQQGLRGEALTKVRQSVQKIARDQGYTIIFDAQVAPYAANDITEEALKVMNTLK